MTLQQALVNLYNASSHAPLTKDQHIACENSYNLLLQFITAIAEKETEKPKAEVMGTEKKVVGWPVTGTSPKKK